MTKSTPEQVTNLLYTKMTNDHLDNMTDDELIFFYGNLHHWAELAKKLIDERRQNDDCQM